jgi:thioredoxin reductase
LVDSLEVVDDHLTGVRLHDGPVVPRQALVVTPRFVARSEVLTELGLHPTAHSFGGEFVTADAAGLTDVPGVWVAGNVTDLAASVVVAAAEGASAAAAINADLVAEDTRRAVSAHRNLPSVAPERVSASVS